MKSFLPVSVIAIAFLPVITAHFGQLYGHDHLSHFPVTLILIGYLIYTDGANRGTANANVRGAGIVYALISLVFLAGAVWLHSGWLGMAAAVFGIWSAVDFSGGDRWRLAFRRPLIMSLALFQPPFGTDQSLIIGLQKVASRTASSWLDLQGIANLVTGVVVRTTKNDYLVAEACSGVNSLFASLMLGLFWVLYRRYRLLRSVVFLGMVFFGVLLVNALRVWLIVCFDHRHDLDLSSEPQHSALGFGMFVLVAVFAASSVGLLQFVLPARHPPEIDPPKKTRRRTPVSQLSDSRNGMASLATIGLAIFVAGAVSFYGPATAAVAQGTIADASLMPEIPFDCLPAKAGNWNLDSTKRIDRDPSDPLGMVSYAWFYSNNDVSIVISLDGPYDNWHDLGYCYGALDWQLRDSRNISLATQASQQPMECVELNMYRGSGQRSIVLFTSFDSRGLVIKPPPAHGTVLRNLVNRFGISDQRQTADGQPIRPPVFQVQMRTQSDSEMSPEDRFALDQLYDLSRRILSDRMFVTRPTEQESP